MDLDPAICKRIEELLVVVEPEFSAKVSISSLPEMKTPRLYRFPRA
jgi:hypothetical protein